MKKAWGHMIILGLAVLAVAACSRNLEGFSSVEPEPSSQSQSVVESLAQPPLPLPSVSSGEVETPSSADLFLPPLPMTADFDQIAVLGHELVQWGPGVHVDERGRSTACIDLQKKYGGFNADFIAADRPTVTLTFDEGYENGYTTPILDTLKEKGVRAVFFLTGHYIESQPELVQRMIDEGHILGNHSNKHKVYVTELTLEESLEDAKWMHDRLREDFDYEMRLFRLPEGAFCEQSLALLQQMGYKSLFWSFAYRDWDPQNQMEPQEAMDRIMATLHPGEIMLLHAVGETNSLILPELIDAIREEGYEIRPYDEIENF